MDNIENYKIKVDHIFKWCELHKEENPKKIDRIENIAIGFVFLINDIETKKLEKSTVNSILNSIDNIFKKLNNNN